MYHFEINVHDLVMFVTSKDFQDVGDVETIEFVTVSEEPLFSW